MACYFLCNVIAPLFTDNNFERNELLAPQFYDIVSQIYNKYNVIYHKSKKKFFYFNIVETEKEPLTDQIKRLDATCDISTIFGNIHENNLTTPTQKQILYRILFGITPTSEGLAKRHKRVFECKFCLSVQESETHIFYECQTLISLKRELISLLRQQTNNSFDLYKAIFLNIIPNEIDKEIYFLKLALIAIYREAIWTARNQATHKECHISDRSLSTIFINKTRYLLKKI